MYLISRSGPDLEIKVECGSSTIIDTYEGKKKTSTAQQYTKLHGLPNVASFETNLKINNQQ